MKKVIQHCIAMDGVLFLNNMCILRASGAIYTTSSKVEVIEIRFIAK